MQAYPDFSVLMSVYYKEKPKHLDLALNSIEVQTIFPYEIVLVEDGPLTFELNKVVKKYKKLWGGKLKVVKLSKNEGLGPALREGTKYITTEWIARMDTDDISVPNRFQLQMNEIITHSNYAVIGGQVDEFMHDPQNVVGNRRVPLKQDEIYNFARYRNPFNHPTVMINKKKLIEVGGYKPSDRLEDYNLWIQFIKNHERVENLNEVLVHMRVNENLYKRRGGFKYLKNYLHMKNMWRKQGIGNYRTMICSDISMIANTFMPVKIRKGVYQFFLHNKKEQ